MSRSPDRGLARAVLLAAPILLASVGCASEPSALSPTSDQDPAKAALASREMDDVARRNREAEAAFYRKVAARPPAITDAH